MKKEMQVVTRVSPLNVRTGPSLSYRVIKTIAKGSKVIATKEENGWYYHDKGGWSSGEYLKVTQDLEPPASKPVEQENPQDSSNKPLTDDQVKKEEVKEEYDEGYDLSEEDILGMSKYNNYSPSDEFDELKVVQGLPFRFLENADIRPEKSHYGRTYLERIIGDGSFLFMIPGKPEFFNDLNNKSKKGLVQAFLDGDDESTLSEIVNDMSGRYYSFVSDYTEYTSYVNAMARTAAIYLGLTDKKQDMDYKDRIWDMNDLSGKNKKNPIYADMENDKCTCFYIDGNATSFSESVSNSSEASAITGLANKGSDMAREFRFLIGNMNELPDSELVEGSMNKVESMIGDLLSSLSNKTGIAGAMGQFGTIARTAMYGGNIMMPDVWRDSSYSKSYNIEIKLISPYADKESIYLNLLIPLFHLMAFSFPRQLGRAGYTAPFIVRAFCKGWFNCDFGIVESFSVKKASQDGWSVDGLPTELDISISIKDLYSTVAISNTKDNLFLKNTEFLDMIGTYCGVNVNKPDLARKMMLIRNNISEVATDALYNLSSSIKENIYNKIHNLLK